MPSESVYLSNHIKRTVRGPMWHGPALDELLAGVSYRDAAARPLPGAHSIWEIVLHVTAWAEISRARLAGHRLTDPAPQEDWPPVSDASEAAWTAAIGRLRESYRELAHDAARVVPSTLHENIAGLEYSASAMLHGVIEHGTYHGGQIALLKRAIAG
jgi:uncharacterized damage-inducible protein DinB